MPITDRIGLDPAKAYRPVDVGTRWDMVPLGPGEDTTRSYSHAQDTRQSKVIKTVNKV